MNARTGRGRRGALLLLLSGLGPLGQAQSLSVATLAGKTGTLGSADGTGADARFWAPNALAADPAGNVYVNDATNFTIRRITPAGIVTTIAGAAGAREYRNATGSAARFLQPTGLARDVAGNLFVGDFDLSISHTTVRKITPAGIVTTFALASAQCLTFDMAGNLIVAGDSRLRAFASNGVEFPPNWPPGRIDVGAVFGIVTGPDGAFYIADLIKNEIRRVSPAGVITNVAGGAGIAGYVDAIGSSARFNAPGGIAVDAAGNLHVSDHNNSVVRRIAPDGTVTTVAGRAGATFVPGFFPDGIGADVRFFGLSCLANGPDGTIYIGEAGAVRRAVVVTAAAKIAVSPQNAVVAAGERASFAVAANGYPAVSFQWQRQAAGTETWVSLADGGAYAGTASAVLVIASAAPSMNGDRFRCTVRNALGSDTSAPASLSVDPPIVVVPLRVSTVAGRAGNAVHADGTGASAGFSGPAGIAVDALGSVYVADEIGNRVRKMTPGGTVTTLAGTGVAGLADGEGRVAQFRQPGPIAVDAQGNVFVADQLGIPDGAALPVIRKITSAGVVTTFVRGVASGPRFGTIRGIAFDREGNLVVSCTAERWLRFTPSGAPTVPALPPGLTQVGSGAMAFDASGNLFAADPVANTVVKLTPAGQVSVLAGTPGSAGAVDGRAGVARFGRPQAVAVDARGNVYVADIINQIIRRITPAGIVSTVAGTKPTPAMANPTGAIDGIGSVVRFNSPRDLAIDRAGNLYVADYANRTIRRAVPVDAVAAGEPTEFYLQSTGEIGAGLAAGAEPRRAALGEGVTVQWFKDAIPILGATSESFRIAATAPGDAGDYTVRVQTGFDAMVSEPVRLTVATSRLVNLSIRSGAGAGAQTLIVGFVVKGGGLPVLVRGVGPGLIPLGVAAPVSDPRLTLHAGESILAANTGWGGALEIADAAARLGAFPLPAGSRDAAMLTLLDQGAFTVQCTAAAGAGIALVELYDASVAGGGRNRLGNVAARSHVGAGEGIMIAGFAIGGRATRRILIRGVGPALAQFGVAGALADPRVKVLDAAANVRAENDNWSDNANAAEIVAAAQAAGAFALSAGSKDATLRLTLEPGSYSIHLSGSDGGSGIGLIEIYDEP